MKKNSPIFIFRVEKKKFSNFYFSRWKKKTNLLDLETFSAFTAANHIAAGDDLDEGEVGALGEVGAEGGRAGGGGALEQEAHQLARLGVSGDGKQKYYQ